MAERACYLEQAAQLSRKPNVHLGPQALRELPGEPESFVHQAERVEKDNEAMAEERDGLLERIKERIEAIYRELQALPEKIREAGERVKAWPDYERRKWVDREFRRESAELAETTRKYYQAVGQPSRTTPRSTQPTAMVGGLSHGVVPYV